VRAACRALSHMTAVFGEEGRAPGGAARAPPHFSSREPPRACAAGKTPAFSRPWSSWATRRARHCACGRAGRRGRGGAGARARRARFLRPRQRPPLLTQADDVGNVVARRVCHADVVGDGERSGIAERDEQCDRHGRRERELFAVGVAVPRHCLLWPAVLAAAARPVSEGRARAALRVAAPRRRRSPPRCCCSPAPTPM